MKKPCSKCANVAVGNCIHLNPVRAKLLAVDQLKNHTLSSYPKYFKKTVHPPIVRKDFLAEDGLPDSLTGIRQYAKHLAYQKEGPTSKKYLRGWAIASEAYKKQLHKDFEKMEVAKDWGGRELQELNELGYERLVTIWLRKHRKTERHIQSDKKSGPFNFSPTINKRD